MTRFLAIVAALLLAAVARSEAETVFIHSGLNEGQGWMFPYGKSCWVATVDHVVNKRAVAFVVRDRGVQLPVPQPDQHVDADLHVALLKLPKMSPDECPASSSGEDDEDATLSRVFKERPPTTMERRSASSSAERGISYGVETMSVFLRASSDQSNGRLTIAVEPLRAARDQIRKTDSGAPILLHGSGIGEAALPLGLVIGVDADGAAVAVRFDRVREFVERTEAPQQPAQVQPFSIVAFTGQTPDTACGPHNVLAPRDTLTRCGWIARSRRAGQITLTLYLGDSPRLIDGVVLRFDPRSTPSEYAVETAEDAGPSAHWKPPHECARRNGAHQWMCPVGKRPARSVRVTINATSVEVQELQIVPYPEESHPR